MRTPIETSDAAPPVASSEELISLNQVRNLRCFVARAAVIGGRIRRPYTAGAETAFSRGTTVGCDWNRSDLEASG